MSLICDLKKTPNNQFMKTTVRSHKRKRRIMDYDLAANCKVVLDKLMKLDHASLFYDRLVDVFRDAGYFNVIKHPMDLRTVQKRLDNDMYVDVEEFESDVRLTFDNAMIYIPRHNLVHQQAKELSIIFDDLCKSIMAEDMTMTREINIKKCASVSCQIEGGGNELSPSNKALLAAMLKNRLDRTRLKAPQVLLVLHSRPGSGIATGRVIRFKQKKSSRVTEVQHAVKVVRQKKREAARMALEKMDKSFDIEDNFHVMREMESPVGNPADNQGRISPNQVSVQEHKKVCELQPNISEAGSQEGIEVEISTSQALRVARLKKQFAWIIVKAQQALMELSQPRTSATDQDRIINLEKERAKMVEEAEHEISRLIQKERQAARMALEKLEQSVDVEDNFRVMREMETLFGYPMAFVV